MSDTNDSAPGKRPYATLDLRATEIKVTPIGEKTQIPQVVAPAVGPPPKPLASRMYATAPEPADNAKFEPRPAGSPKAYGASQQTSSKIAETAAAMTNPSATSASEPAVIVKKRGGFFSHLAAGIIGGAMALGAWQWGLPELSERGYVPVALGARLAMDNPDLARRVAALEKAQANDEIAVKLQSNEARLAELEKSAVKTMEVKDIETRFAAETKAALASVASDAGAAEQLTRLGAIESRLKAMTEAGAGDPNAGRLEQLAAVTGKVSDLETSLAIQLTALRKSVGGDVDARLASIAESAEAAKAGAQRLDRELATLKSDAAKSEDRLAALKSDDDRTAEALRKASADVASLKSSIDALMMSTAKPSDVASAVDPLSGKLSALEAELKSVVKAEEGRRTNAERVVLALELQNLKRALDRGQKYDAELAGVEKAANGKFDLGPLSKFKEQGVPTVAELTREFAPSANAIIDAEQQAADGSVVGRLIAGAKAVVRVRKVNHDDRDKTAEAVASRMETALKEGRLGDVIAEAEQLSPKAKDAAAPFIGKVSARASVDKALASLEGQLKTSLSGASAEPAKTQ